MLGAQASRLHSVRQHAHSHSLNRSFSRFALTAGGDACAPSQDVAHFSQNEYHSTTVAHIINPT